MDKPVDLVVIGGGPSGLAYALGARHAAQAAGRSERHVVLEASSRPGGWVVTRRSGAYLLETGPYGYLDKHPELGQIVAALGLEEAVCAPAPAAQNRFIYARGKLRKLPRGPGGFLASRLIRPRAKLRVLREPWAPPHPGGDESVAAFATRRLGREAAESLVVPMFTGIYAGDPDGASLAACFPRMAELERDYGGLFRALWRLRKQVKQAKQGVGAPKGALTSFRGGLSTLVEAMADALGPALRTDAPVEAVRRGPDGYSVSLESGETIQAHRVVVAIPASHAVQLLRPLDGALAELLARIPYIGVAVVHTAFGAEQARRIPQGFGFLVPRQAQRQVLGTVFVSRIFPEQAPADEVLLRTIVGGALRPDLVQMPDTELLELVLGELSTLLGVSAAPSFVDVERYPAALPQYQVGHLELLSEVDAIVASYPGLELTGNAYRGIGLADCLALNYRRSLHREDEPS